MIRNIVIACAIAGAATVTRAQGISRAPCDADGIRRHICAVDDSLGAALVRADTSAIARVYSDDLVTINYRGARLTKPILLAAIGTGRLRFDTLTSSNRIVEVSGDTAVLLERMHQVATGPEGRHPTEVDYRRIYVRRQTGWQLVAAVINVAPPK